MSDGQVRSFNSITVNPSFDPPIAPRTEIESQLDRFAKLLADKRTQFEMVQKSLDAMEIDIQLLEKTVAGMKDALGIVDEGGARSDQMAVYR